MARQRPEPPDLRGPAQAGAQQRSGEAACGPVRHPDGPGARRAGEAASDHRGPCQPQRHAAARGLRSTAAFL